MVGVKMKKKVIIIIAVVCVAIIAVVGTIFGVNAYNNYTIQQQTEQQVKSIDDTYSKFTKETDRAKKLVILSDFIKNKPSTSDEIKVEVLNSVEPKYNETLAKMQKFFTDDYDKTIKDNTIDSKTLEKTNDKKKLQSCIDNLEALKKTIDYEKSNVFYKNDIGNYDKKPDELISSYNDRITAIEKAEAEAKAKKEAEAKKKAEEKAKQEKKKHTESSNKNNTDNSYSDNTNSYSDSGNSYDSGNNNYSSNDSNYSSGNNSSNSSGNYSRWSYTDETGTYYHDSNGNKWDSNGNKYEYDPDDDINSWGYPEDE
jgi:ribosomal protein L12E/L44/L45/RPP1/RPP2